MMPYQLPYGLSRRPHRCERTKKWRSPFGPGEEMGRSLPKLEKDMQERSAREHERNATDFLRFVVMPGGGWRLIQVQSFNWLDFKCSNLDVDFQFLPGVTINQPQISISSENRLSAPLTWIQSPKNPRVTCWHERKNIRNICNVLGVFEFKTGLMQTRGLLEESSWSVLLYCLLLMLVTGSACEAEKETAKQ